MQGKHVGTFGAMSIFSFQTTKVMPAIEGGMGMYQTREYYERATGFLYWQILGWDRLDPWGPTIGFGKTGDGVLVYPGNQGQGGGVRSGFQ